LSVRQSPALTLQYYRNTASATGLSGFKPKNVRGHIIAKPGLNEQAGLAVIVSAEHYVGLFFVAVITAYGAFFHFHMAPFADFVCPVLTEFCNLARPFLVALYAVFQHFLMFLMRETYRAL
jgi:hypothetical protein